MPKEHVAAIALGQMLVDRGEAIQACGMTCSLA
jgi:hypothetical protein